MYSYLVYVDTVRNSNKFWSAKVEGNQVTVEWGRVGYNSQKKVHSLTSNQQAVFKYQNLVDEKHNKGYKKSQALVDNNCELYEIQRAIRLLDILRPYIQHQNFDDSYVDALNQYLKIVPTPLGMQINPYRVYRTVADVDHQRELLKSLLVNEPIAVQSKEMAQSEPKNISLKTISKSFWRHL